MPRLEKPLQINEISEYHCFSVNCNYCLNDYIYKVNNSYNTQQIETLLTRLNTCHKCYKKIKYIYDFWSL